MKSVYGLLMGDYVPVQEVPEDARYRSFSCCPISWTEETDEPVPQVLPKSVLVEVQLQDANLCQIASWLETKVVPDKKTLARADNPVKAIC